MSRIHLVLCALPLVLAACNETPAAAPDINSVYFAPSLGVDLTTMSKTPSGAYYTDTVLGTGATAAVGDSVYLFYTVYLSSGSKIDAVTTPPFYSVKLGDEGQLIVGFDEGVRGMRVGGLRTVVVPPSLGYGATTHGGAPPNSYLVFTLDLRGVKKL